jgi:hypothetical protein
MENHNMTDQVQCPNCSNSKTISTEFRVNPKTGERIPHKQGVFARLFSNFIGGPALLIGVLLFGIYAFFVDQTLLLWTVVLGILGAGIRQSVAATKIMQENFYKECPAGYDHTCESCGKKWTVNPKI